jgi:hypothetical protein
MLDTAIWALVQLPIAFTMLALQLLHRGLKFLVVTPWHALENPYYAVVQFRRRLRGDPLVQEHDKLIGRGPPPPPPVVLTGQIAASAEAAIKAIAKTGKDPEAVLSRIFELLATAAAAPVEEPAPPVVP